MITGANRVDNKVGFLQISWDTSRFLIKLIANIDLILELNI